MKPKCKECGRYNIAISKDGYCIPCGSEVESGKVEEPLMKQIERAWGYANFGEPNKYKVVYEALCNIAMGYSTGHTIETILRELRMIRYNRHEEPCLNEKGMKFIKEYHTKKFPTDTIK